jgi:hypothetical protein
MRYAETSLEALLADVECDIPVRKGVTIFAPVETDMMRCCMSTAPHLSLDRKGMAAPGVSDLRSGSEIPRPAFQLGAGVH